MSEATPAFIYPVARQLLIVKRRNYIKRSETSSSSITQAPLCPPPPHMSPSALIIQADAQYVEALESEDLGDEERIEGGRKEHKGISNSS